MCCFVCAVTALAGIEDCLNLFLPAPPPTFAFLTALISALILKKGLKALKILNTAQMAMAIVYIIAMCFYVQKGVVTTKVSFGKPIIYALFDITVSIGILAPLSQSSKKQNVAATAVATFLLCALLCAVIFFADFSAEMPLFCLTENFVLNVFFAVTLLLATVTGVAANLLPVVQFVNTAVNDSALSAMCVFFLAVAFSMLGFDFALKYGYVFVAVFGMLTIVKTTKPLSPRRLLR